MTETFTWLSTPGSLFSISEHIHLAQAVPAKIQYPWLYFDYSWLHVLVFILLVAFNAFFVALEVALVKLRRAQLADLEGEENEEQVEVTRMILNDLGKYIPVCKFGSSIAGILLGAITVPWIVQALVPLIGKLGFYSVGLQSFIAFVISIFVTLAILVAFGKIIPNTYGFREEVKVSLGCSRLLHHFYLATAIMMIPLTAFSNWFISHVFKLKPASDREREHSAEDIKIFVEESGADAVTPTEKEILINALELNDLKVLDILTPRSEIVALDLNDPFEDNLQKALDSTHSRFPVYKEHIDHIEGMVHIKEMVGLLNDKNPYLEKVIRVMDPVNENVALDELLKYFLNKRVHMAYVVDEYGGTIGIVMLGDLLETLVGEINDEFDREEEVLIEKVSEDEFIVDGSMPLHELDDEVPELELQSPHVATVGGYVTEILGHHPEEKETTEIEDFNVEVLETTKRKVVKVRFTRKDESELEEIEPVKSTKEKSKNKIGKKAVVN